MASKELSLMAALFIATIILFILVIINEEPNACPGLCLTEPDHNVGWNLAEDTSNPNGKLCVCYYADLDGNKIRTFHMG